ncbi:MAG: hypothetical protein F6K19_34160 [Cyanothece sp. SIO1E1]|nr:hypothetical protein [Cyanothece sp. SIO1E1]
MDTNDPFLRRNLNRLEARFRERYYSSVQKDLKRRGKGKNSHETTLKSIQENRKRLAEVKAIRYALFDKSSLAQVGSDISSKHE